MLGKNIFVFLFSFIIRLLVFRFICNTFSWVFFFVFVIRFLVSLFIYNTWAIYWLKEVSVKTTGGLYGLEKKNMKVFIWIQPFWVKYKSDVTFSSGVLSLNNYKHLWLYVLAIITSPQRVCDLRPNKRKVWFNA